MFIRRHGVILEAAAGPVPSLTSASAGKAIRASWWAHPRSHEIFEVTRAIRDSEEVLVCRLVGGKITYVHRRVWPALIRVAKHLPRKRLARLHELHTRPGHHATKQVAFPKRVPLKVSREALKLGEEAASSQLGAWCS